MKVAVKLLKGETFHVEAEPSTTVAELKAKIEAAREDCGAPSCQKLIFQGRILVDEKTVGDYPISESNFLVVMTQKPKTAAPATAPAVASTAAPAEAPPAASAAAEATSTLSETEPAAPVVAPASAPPTEAHLLALSGVRMENVEQLCAMGFPRPEVIRCLRAAFGNADRAVEYLTTGIPDVDDDEADADGPDDEAPGSGDAPSPTAATNDTGTSAATAVPGEAPTATPFPAMGVGGGGGGGEAAVDLSQLGNLDLDSLRDNPQFQQLRTMIQQNPGMLQELMQNPEFMQLVMRLDQDELMAILQDVGEDGDDEGDETEDFFNAMQQAGGTGGANVELSEAENEAVERLQQLGFTREVAVQAYVACGKNEEVAASMLFEHGDDAMMSP